jgi:hypothetical protein
MQELEKGLQAARLALINHGYCAHGADGSGDIEINAIDAALTAMAGQPIDTAPKDGTRILAFCPNAGGSKGNPIYRVTWWRQAKDRAGYIGWGEFNIEYWPPTKWWPLPNVNAL